MFKLEFPLKILPPNLKLCFLYELWNLCLSLHLMDSNLMRKICDLHLEWIKQRRTIRDSLRAFSLLKMNIINLIAISTESLQ